jgi:hypothetical protein
MLLVLPGNYHELHRSPFHSQRSYKIKGHTAFMLLTRQRHKKSGNASLLKIKNDIPTGGDAITLIGYYSESVSFPNAYCIYIKDASSDQEYCLSSYGWLRENGMDDRCFHSSSVLL